MKSGSLLLLFLISTFQLVAQERVSTGALSQTDYLKKSKKQKRAAIITSAAGVGILLITVASASATPVSTTYGNDETESVGTVPAVIGLAGVATGIYLFVASGKNKRLAKNAAVYLDVEKVSGLHVGLPKSRSYPALGLRIGL